MPTPTPGDTPPAIGAAVSEIETPAVVADLPQMETNIAWYDAFAREHDVALRSHIKTHKIPDLAHRQVDLPAGNGILCQSLGEAELMAQSGIDDIYLSYMIVQPTKLERLVRLSEKLDAFATTVDCRGNVDPLQAAAAEHGVTVDVVLELDVGQHRVGVQPDGMVEFASYVAEQPNLSIAGLMAFEGHLKSGAETEDDLRAQCLAAMDTIADAVADLEDAGIAVEDVKVGSTGTSRYSGTHDVVTEINPGMYPFFDVATANYPVPVSIDDCALQVVSTVISKPTDDRVIVDAGSKTISMDVSVAPVCLDDPGVDYYNYSEEHGWVDIGEADIDPAVGDRLTFVPPHVCTTINLHDVIIGARDGVVEETWSVQGRGKVR